MDFVIYHDGESSTWNGGYLMESLTVSITMSPEQRYSYALHSQDARPGALSAFLTRNPGWRPFPVWEWTVENDSDSLVGDDYSGHIGSLHDLASDPGVVRLTDERVEKVNPLNLCGRCSLSPRGAEAVVDHARLFVNDGGDRLLITQPYIFGKLLEEGLALLCAQECAPGLAWRIALPTSSWYHPAASLAFIGKPEVVNNLSLGSLQAMISAGALEVER